MDDIRSIVNTITRVALILTSVTLLVWAFLPAYREICTGFVIGVLIGLINIRYLAVKVTQITEYVAGQDMGKKRLSLGFVTRLCISLIGIMIAVRFEQVSLGATLIGIFLMPVLMIPVSIIHTYQSNKH